MNIPEVSNHFRSDYDVCVKAQNYMDHIASRTMQLGDSLKAAMTGANEQIPGSADFLRHTFRELGKIKGQRNQWLESVHVDRALHELSPHDQQAKEKFWDDKHGEQIVLRSLARLTQEGYPLFDANDVKDDIEENEQCRMQKSKVNEVLRAFSDEGLISKDQTPGKKMYQVPFIERLVLFMNPEKGEIPDVDDVV